VDDSKASRAALGRILEAGGDAVVFGMPRAAAGSGAVDELLPLDRLAACIVRFGTEG
jgi:chemotaxis response regulator CheB